MELISDELSGNLFENVYSDETRLFEPRAVFKDRTLLNHITKKFPSGFRDYKLEDKVIKFWSDRNLPKSNKFNEAGFTIRVKPKIYKSD